MSKLTPRGSISEAIRLNREGWLSDVGSMMRFMAFLPGQMQTVEDLHPWRTDHYPPLKISQLKT
jgi:hypothetical protein